MPSDLQSRKRYEKSKIIKFFKSVDKDLNNLQLTNLQSLAGLPLDSLRSKAHVPRSPANFEPAISLPEVNFGGAGVLKDVRNRRWCRIGGKPV